MEMVDSKKAEMMAEMGGLDEDVLVHEIFDRIPIKQLAQMKCLSKGWYSLISNYRKSKLRSSSKNFICLYAYNRIEGRHAVVYNINEQVDNQTGEIVVETLENQSLSFFIDDSFQLVGSSNGLMLGYCKRSGVDDNSFGDYYEYAREYFVGDDYVYVGDNSGNILVPYVCNPIINQWNALPPFSKGKRSILMGLAFDGIHFKVVICYVRYVKKCGIHISRHIYSSRTGKWRKKLAKFFNSCILTNEMMIQRDFYLYRKGMAHWVFSNGFMLVYHFKKDFFKIIKLPSTEGCVWESEGYLHYCDNNIRGFSIWKLVDDEIFDTQFDGENAMAKWQQHKPIIEFRSLKPQFLKVVDPGYQELLRKSCIRLFGFDEDLQILYFSVLDKLFSYSFETRRLKKLTCEHIIDCFCASFFLQPSGVNLPLGGDCKLLIPKKECQGTLGKAQILLQ